MKIDDDILKSVGFVAAKRMDGTYRLCGSLFFLGLKHALEPGKATDIVWVTARHVIEGIRALGCTEVQIRLNTIEGTSRWLSTPLSSWFLPPDPTNDVAILSRELSDDLDDHKLIGPQLFLTKEIQDRVQFGITDEVIVVGLFTHRAGNQRNVPIVRIGNIASLDHEETVTTKLGQMPAYLIECRSIGGLSGSPVFVLTGFERTWQGKTTEGEPNIFLLGLIHGHYDVADSAIDEADDAGSVSPSRVNTGIAIVTPFWRLQEALEAFQKHRARLPSIFQTESGFGSETPFGISLTSPRQTR